MKESFDKAFDQLCIFEGYSSNLKGDPGGRTLWGIAEKYHPHEVALMLNMTPDDAKAYAKAFYEREYWDALGCDDLPAPLDAICFDTAVNPGPSVARKILNETRDWKDFLFKRLFYYSTDVQTHPEKEKFFRGWVNRCLTLWGKNKGGA
jgi:lysozyme family protein